MPWPLALVAILSIIPGSRQSHSADLPVKVRALVKQLDADQFAIRKAARVSLLEIGPDALPFLKEPKDASVQLQLELEQVRERLRNQRAVHSLDPSTVTIEGKLTVDQIASRLTKQSGNPVSVAKLSPQTRGRTIEVAFTGHRFGRRFWDFANNCHAV